MRGGCLAARLDELKARTQHFFHAMEFRPPQFAHVVEALIDRVEAVFDPFLNRASKRRSMESSRAFMYITSRLNMAALRKIGKPIARQKLYVRHHAPTGHLTLLAFLP